MSITLRIGIFLVVCWGVSLFLVTDWLSRDFAIPGSASNYSLSVSPPEKGDVLDSWRKVEVVHNGKPYWKSQGRHFAESGYYYGKKWQCVEYIKRFFYDALGHEMPDVMGHANSFFDPTVPHGGINPQRGLIQFKNGLDEPPRPDDLVVWRYGTYGHVAIVTRVEPDAIQVIQQNVVQGTRQWLPRRQDGDQEWIGTPDWTPAGWLRIPSPALGTDISQTD